MSVSFLKRKEVEKMTTLAYQTFNKMEKEGRFPNRKQLTECRVAWLYSDIADWVTSRSNSLSHA